MKLCRFDQDRIGIVQNDEVLDITDRVAPFLVAPPAPGDPLLVALPRFSGRIPEFSRGARKVPVGKVSLLSPVLHPTKIVAVGRNYRAHREEMQQRPASKAKAKPALPEGVPPLFIKSTSSLVGPSAGIARRFPDRLTEHEIELVVVIGRRTEAVPAAQALGHVAGYTIGVDVTLRGPEDTSLRKSIDSYSVAGPWLVTADEISDPDNLRLKSACNGALRQDASTADMIVGVADAIAYASKFFPLYPGDLLFTGTPSGVGPIEPGDILDLECEGIGAMRVAVRGYEEPATQR